MFSPAMRVDDEKARDWKRILSMRPEKSCWKNRISRIRRATRQNRREAAENRREIFRDFGHDQPWFAHRPHDQTFPDHTPALMLFMDFMRVDSMLGDSMLVDSTLVDSMLMDSMLRSFMSRDRATTPMARHPANH